ncbi:hypothetical protein Sango_2329700 [Sesamum angolense]|uniref:MULE transposase domain-containing protein n=1 Tax=Sesamum angolense TaxID=2727404 RepID=A0AAE2BLN4_9LAMI|nr:hypothetical protein Sango_2329700 [Sesamum angolense]
MERCGPPGPVLCPPNSSSLQLIPRHSMRRMRTTECVQNQAYRAKWKALARIEGSSTDQYGKLWDYAEELRSSNPGSTMILQKATNNDDDDRPVFGNFYVCFKGLKEGYLAGCRPIIGVDGCHLKRPHRGVLLIDVGIDPNNDSFPLCYAVVGGETRETWEWFLYLIKHDLHIENAHEWTFMSDKQKGLVPAFETVFPTSNNSVETYLSVYQHCIYPVNSPEKWKQTGGVPLLPPNIGRGLGRPPRARRMEHDEARNKQKNNTFYSKSKQLKMRRQQVTLHFSNFLETGNFSSQASLQQTFVTSSSSQGGPSNEAESVGIEKQPVVTARSKQSGPSKKRKSISVEKQPARRSTRLQSAKPISNELIAQPAKNTARSNLGFNLPRRMPPMPTTNLSNPALIPPARGGVTIRPPFPFARGHPRVAVSISTQKMSPLQHQFKVIDKDGQKYVTMKSLEDALNARAEAAKRARIECDGKGKQ